MKKFDELPNVFKFKVIPTPRWEELYKEEYSLTYFAKKEDGDKLFVSWNERDLVGDTIYDAVDVERNFIGNMYGQWQIVDEVLQ